MEKGGAVTSGSSSQYALKTRAAGQPLSVPSLCFFSSQSFTCAKARFAAPREWLIPPSTNIDVYAAAEQLTFQMISFPLGKIFHEMCCLLFWFFKGRCNLCNFHPSNHKRIHLFLCFYVSEWQAPLIFTRSASKLFSEGVAEMADVAVPHQPCYVFHLSIGRRQQFAGVLHAAI